MRTTPHILASLATLALASSALAQDKSATPLEAATEHVADKPLTAAPVALDADIAKLSTLLQGTFTSTAADNQPALLIHIAPTSVASLPGSLLVEVARADSPATPFRLYFLHPYRRQSELRLRMFDVPSSGLRDALAGLWAAPDRVPALDLASLAATADLRVTPTAAGFDAATVHPFPTARDHAIEFTSSLTISDAALRISDTGFDADGLRVWGQKPGEFAALTRNEPKPLVTREDNIVFVTTVAPKPEAAKLVPGGQATLHYTSWLTNGQLVETSRAPGKQPTTVTIPGNLLPGLNRGLIGIAAGERRKLIISPALAYGADGRGIIPPNATLIFDVECLKIDNDAQSAPPAPTRMFNPHAAPPGGAAPAPINPNAPIGSPPTNGGPEAPRGGPH